MDGFGRRSQSSPAGPVEILFAVILTENNDGMKKEKVRKLIEKGALIAQGSAASILSYASGSPEAAIILGGIGTSGVYQRVSDELAQRLLGDREQTRVGGVLSMSIHELENKLRSGQSLRTDDFFEKATAGVDRSKADEIIEGVLKCAQSEYQEKKLQHLAYFWANACISDLDAGTLNYLLGLFDQLSYRQLAILAMIGLQVANRETRGNLWKLREEDYTDEEVSTGSHLGFILGEIEDLRVKSCVQNDGWSATSAIPSELSVGAQGVRLYLMFELHRIPKKEFQDVIEILK